MEHCFLFGYLKHMVVLLLEVNMPIVLFSINIMLYVIAGCLIANGIIKLIELFTMMKK